MKFRKDTTNWLVLQLFLSTILLCSRNFVSVYWNDCSKYLSGERPNGDAIVKLVGGSSFYDYILKYPIEPKEPEDSIMRDAFLRQLLEHHVYYDLETSRNGQFTYVKLIIPFDIFLKQAEKLRFKFPINVSVIHILVSSLLCSTT